MKGYWSVVQNSLSSWRVASAERNVDAAKWYLAFQAVQAAGEVYLTKVAHKIQNTLHIAHTSAMPSPVATQIDRAEEDATEVPPT
jgi:hypothetical protein